MSFTTIEGDSFNAKIAEQLKLLPCLGNILVVPNNQKKEFEQEFPKLSKQILDNSIDIFAFKRITFAPTWLNQNHVSEKGWLITEQGQRFINHPI